MNNLERLERKMETARRELPAPILDGSGAEVGIIGYGSSHHAVVEARDQLVSEKRLKTDYLRVLAYPFSPEVQAFIERHPRVYVVEQNRDGQLRGAPQAGPARRARCRGSGRWRTSPGCRSTRAA